MGKEQEDNTDIYLVVADETDGFQLALRYVARKAKEDGARLAILYVQEEQEMQAWAGVAKQMEGDQREATELLISNAAEMAQKITGELPGIYLQEGGRFQKIIDVINNDHHIKKLILGAEANATKPGPLVSYFTGKGLSQLRVPLTIIPGHISLETVDEMN